MKFSEEEDEKIQKILLEIYSLTSPTHTPFKKHLLPDYMRYQLYKLLIEEHPNWSIPQIETEKRIAKLNRENHQPSIFNIDSSGATRVSRNKFLERLQTSERPDEEIGDVFGTFGSNSSNIFELSTPSKQKGKRPIAELSLTPKSTKKTVKLDLDSSISVKPKSLNFVVDVTPKRSSRRISDRSRLTETPKKTPKRPISHGHTSPATSGSDPFYSPGRAEAIVPDLNSSISIQAEQKLEKLRVNLFKKKDREAAIVPDRRRSPRLCKK